MSLFKSPKKNILGVDLGSSSIKIVELKKTYESNIELCTYGFAKFKVNDIKKDSVIEQEKIIAVLKKLCKESNTTAANAIASIPPFFVFSSIINLPEMSKSDIESAVQWEARKVIPLPLEQIELKWKIIDIKGDKKDKDVTEKESPDKVEKDEKKKTQILLTGAAKKIVQRYVHIFKRVGLNLYSLEVESFSLSRSLLNKKEKAVVMIVDIGALNTNISIVKSGIPFLNKSIDIGSFTISKIIANSLNINLERAEQFQYDIGVSLDKIDTQRDTNSTIPKIIEDSLSSIINEIKYSFSLYEEYKTSILDPDDKIEKVVLTGGGIMIPNLAEYLENLLNIKVYIGDPWNKISYDEELKLVLQEIGPTFAVSIGLAMRDLV